jgi:hypothetical protein
MEKEINTPDFNIFDLRTELVKLCAYDSPDVKTTIADARAIEKYILNG